MVRLSHSYTPAKAVGQNETPFGRDTCVVPSRTALDCDPFPTREEEILGSETQSKFALQIAAKPLEIAE